MNEITIKKFKEKIKAKSIYGASLILVENSECDIINEGIKNFNNPHDYITDNTLYSIGSITKLFTALLACDFIINKKLKIDTTLGELFSTFELNEPLKKINIFGLLTHTSGLPRLPINFEASIKDINDPYKYYGETQLLEFLSYGEPEHESGKMIYSNLGYGLLGFLLEKISIESYSTLLTLTILKPLKMDATISYETGDVLRDNAIGYTIENKPTPFWDMGILKGAGSILSTPKNIQKFLLALINENSSITNLLNESQNILDNKMAWGWMKHDFLFRLFGAKNNLWHNGMTGGFASYFEVNKKIKKGFAILYNKPIDPKFISFDIISKFKCTDY